MKSPTSRMSRKSGAAVVRTGLHGRPPVRVPARPGTPAGSKRMNGNVEANLKISPQETKGGVETLPLHLSDRAGVKPPPDHKLLFQSVCRETVIYFFFFSGSGISSSIPANFLASSALSSNLA